MAVRDYLAIYRRAFASYGNHNGSSYAASIAYSAVFSIFPLMLLAIAFVGFFLHSPEQRQRVADALFSTLRSGVTRDALRQQVDAIAGGSGPLGVIGLIGATWSGMSVFDQVRLSLNLVWGTTKPAPFAQQKWIDLRMLLSVGLLVLLSFVATGLLTALARFGAGFGGAELGAGLRALLRAGSIVIPAVISFLAFTLLYCLAPRARVRSSDVWLGAVTAAGRVRVHATAVRLLRRQLRPLQPDLRRARRRHRLPGLCLPQRRHHDHGRRDCQAAHRRAGRHPAAG